MIWCWSQMTVDPAVTLDPASTTVNIQDGTSVTIGFDEETYTVTEGNSASVTVSVLSGALARVVVVTLQTMDDTAAAPADYTAMSTDLTFNAATSTRTVVIPTTGDMVLEMSESFSVSLSQMPMDAAVTLDPASTTVIIQDNDSVTIGFNATTYPVTEGDSVSVGVSVLSGTLARDVVVTVQTVGGFATAPADYTAMSTDLTFNADTSTQIVVIPTTGDMVLEMSESFSVSLSQMPADTAVTLDPASTTVIIQDNDSVTIGFDNATYPVTEGGSVSASVSVLSGSLARDVVVTLQTVDGTATAVQIGFQNPSYTVAENVGPVKVIATTTGQVQLAREVIVTFTTVDGSASAPDDYTAVSESVTFSIRSNSVSVDITVQSDSMDEMTAETFSVILSSGDSAVVLGQYVTTVTIVDPPAITIDPSAQTNVVPGMSAVFTVVATGSDLTHQWQRAGVNLTDDTKYSGTTTASLTVMNVEEADEGTFRCIVTNAVDSVTSSGTLLTVLIDEIMPDNVTATLGTNVMFNCSASGSIDISYRWTRTVVGTDGSLVDVGFNDDSKGLVVGVDTPMLTILNVSVLDIEEGQDYTCFVNVSDTTVGYRRAILRTRTITILEPLPSFNISEGEDLALRCVARNNDDAPGKVQFFWYRNDRGLVDDGAHIRIVPSGENASREASSWLEVVNVMDADSGNYTCRVTNRDLVDAISIHSEITVLFSPDLNFSAGGETLNGELRRNVGEDLTLSCTATAVPPATFVEIRRNGIVLSDKQGSGSRSLSVDYNLPTTLMLSDSAVYGCVASNSEGMTVRNFTLQVQDIPGEVDTNTVVRMLVSLTSVRLTWDQPEENNGQITSYNVTYCPTATIDLCADQTLTIISLATMNPRADLVDLVPVRRYRVYIQAENGAGLGPQSQPYFFDSANAEDVQPEDLMVVFVSDTGVVLSWQLPGLAMSESAIISLSYSRRVSDITTTVTMPQQQDETQGATIVRLDAGGLYDFTVTAIYQRLTLTSTAANVSQQTQRYIPVDNPTVPTVQSDSITVSWPAPDGEEFVENYLVEYTAISRAGQSSARKRRQAETLSHNITVRGTQRSTQLEGADLQPFSDYTFRVFADFGNGLVAQIVAPFTTTSAQVAAPDGTTTPPESTTAPSERNSVGAIAGAVAGAAVGSVTIISISIVIIVVIVTRNRRARFDLRKEDSQGASAMSGGASEIKNIPMAECMAYGTLHTHQAEGRDVSVNQCVVYGVFEGQQMGEGEDGVYESVEGDYEPIPN